jgi:hypothetical protein
MPFLAIMLCSLSSLRDGDANVPRIEPCKNGWLVVEHLSGQVFRF